MTRLTWTKHDRGWQSGRYLIELAAPRLWVLTSVKSRAGGDHDVRIEDTAGSLSVLKGIAADLETKRISRSRLVSRCLAMVAAIAGLMTFSTFEATWAPAAIVGMSLIGFWALLGAIDSILRRSWESISATYQ
ncbi:MAG TPA: hypothetical protein VGB33_05245 [Acidimicrobiia bacterium]